MLAASPTAHQPCGANGVQLSPPRDGSAIADRGRDHDDEHRRQPELEARRDAQPERVRGEHGAEHQEPDDDGDARARAGQVRDVVAADQRHRGTAEENRRHEPDAGHRRRRVAEARAHVGGHAAGYRMTDAERGERDRERRGERRAGPPTRESRPGRRPARRAPERAARPARSAHRRRGLRRVRLRVPLRQRRR